MAPSLDNPIDWFLIAQWPYVIGALIIGAVVLFVFGGWLDYWSLHEWRVGIKAAVRKQHQRVKD